MYQVLARRWRPRSLDEVMGQEHAVAVLRHGLDTGQVHHAYLLAGLYGVGKTSLGRILAKCLNCETGITSQPCNQCASCRAAEDGSFPDLMEVDAASKTKVEETRAMLDGMGYRPVMGRFRVYLIDEVHMLSGHSFNALLKTLEEPPEHVRFILATTELDRVPLTVASRCLVLRLRRLQPAELATHLRTVLNKDGTPHEDEAVAMLAEQARGSVREVLSLAEQALAAGRGSLRLDAVRTMLGLLDRQGALHLLEAVAARDSRALQEVLCGLLEQGVDEMEILDGAIRLLTELAWVKALPPGAKNDPQATPSEISGQTLPAVLLDALSTEEIHVFLEFATRGKRDLPVLPDRSGALAVVFLRMMAFGRKQAASSSTETRSQAQPIAAATRHASPSAHAGSPGTAGQPATGPRLVPAEASGSQPAGSQQHGAGAEGSNKTSGLQAFPDTPVPVHAGPDDWPAVLDQLGLGGRILSAARSCRVLDRQQDIWTIGVPQRIAAMLDDQAKATLQDAIGKTCNLTIRFAPINEAADGGDPVARFMEHPVVQAVSRDPLLGGGQVAVESIRRRARTGQETT